MPPKQASAPEAMYNPVSWSLSKPQMILGIDPGTAHTGCVFVCEKRIIAAATIKTTPKTGDFEDLMARGKIVRTEIESVIAAIRPDVAVIEGYKDYGGGYKRAVSKRYYTASTISFIVQALDGAGIETHFQYADTVKSAMKAYLDAWEVKQHLIEGDAMLKNEHLRDAGAHALYYELEQRR